MFHVAKHATVWPQFGDKLSGFASMRRVGFAPKETFWNCTLKWGREGRAKFEPAHITKMMMAFNLDEYDFYKCMSTGNYVTFPSVAPLSAQCHSAKLKLLF